MSISHNIYFGPFVSCEKNYTKTYEQKWGCQETGCPRYRSEIKTNFCHECGKPVSTWSVERTVPKVDPFLVIGETLAKVDVDKKDHDILIPNEQRPKRPRRFRYDAKYDTEVLNVTDFTLQAHEVVWFRDAYHEEIRMLEEAYGNKNVNVCWGFLLWHS